MSIRIQILLAILLLLPLEAALKAQASLGVQASRRMSFAHGDQPRRLSGAAGQVATLIVDTARTGRDAPDPSAGETPALPGTPTLPSALTLDILLPRLAESSERFWKEFTAVSCSETVSQRKLGSKGKVAYERSSIFDYLIVMNIEEGELSVEESRILQKEPGKSKQMSLLVTNGFPTLFLVFHPHYQGSFEYLIEGEDVMEGQAAIRIAFRQMTSARSTTALRLRGRDFPLELKGTAWIDPATASVLRMESALKKPMGELGLEALDCAVRYAPVTFADQSAPYWLPQEARIEARTRHQHWQNVHRFTGYKHFTVKSETEVQQ